MEVMVKMEKPDSEDCKGQCGESAAEEAREGLEDGGDFTDASSSPLCYYVCLSPDLQPRCQISPV